MRWARQVALGGDGMVAEDGLDECASGDARVRTAVELVRKQATGKKEGREI